MTFGRFNEFEIRMAQMFGHPFGQFFEELCIACMMIDPKAQGAFFVVRKKRLSMAIATNKANFEPIHNVSQW